MREELHEVAESYGKSIMFADGYDGALLGYITSDDDEWLTSVYDANKIVEILMTDGMDEDESWEFFYFNIHGSYVGKGTPVYINC